MFKEKKYGRTAKNIPKGFNSANDFFEYLFNNKDIIWMGQNTNHLHEEDYIYNGMAECLKSREYSKYPPSEGFSELKKLILNDLNLNDSDILISSGGTDSLYLAMNVILEPQHNVITSDPGYLIIDNFASRFANDVIQVPIYSEECDYKLTPKLVKENMNENTKVIILVDPLNPLGTSYTSKEIEEFAKIAIENDIYLIHDVTYKDFAREHHSIANYAPNNSITIYSFSKIFGMAGLRIGAMISNHDIISGVKTIIINDLGTNIVAQAGAIAGLKSKDKWLDDVVKTTRNNQRLIKSMIDNVDDVFIVNYPSDGNMLAIDIEKTGINSEELAEYLLDKNIFTRGGNYTSPNFGDKYLRVSFSIPEKEVKIFNQEFPKAIEILRTK
ncbi:MAG: pyridoxal phosphate-dependent aminotransferase [Methanobrevibacter sp.]|jgi:aspartate/methionine/tyrosine aminotransferase|nr:pyridoxal phosphate-dependent aminotransferase [Candidatus Methanovirga aequatorialis]